MTESELSSKSSGGGGGVAAGPRVPTTTAFDSAELEMIDKCAIERFEQFEIFKNNPKFYARLKLVTDTDSFYEAQQLYKTIHFRCNIQNLVDESLTILFNGVVYFLRKNSLLCGFDLAKTFVEALKNSKKTSLDNDLRIKIKIIHKMLRPGMEERNEFSMGVLKWSSGLFDKVKLDMKHPSSVHASYQKTFGHYDLHEDFANNLWKEKNYVQARYHFLHSADARSFAQMTIECHLNFGYPSEYDLFLAQSVLLYLTLRQLRNAEKFFEHYVTHHPSVRKVKIENAATAAAAASNPSVIDCYESPLVNFVHLFILVLKNNSYKTYMTLLDAYKPTLQRDTSLYIYIDKVSELFFNVKKQTPGQGGFLSNILRMMTSSNTNQMESGSGDRRGNDDGEQRIDDHDDFDNDEDDDEEDEDDEYHRNHRRTGDNRQQQQQQQQQHKQRRVVHEQDDNLD